MTRDPAALKTIAADPLSPGSDQRVRQPSATASATPSPGSPAADDCEALWTLCLDIAQLRRRGSPPSALPRRTAGNGAAPRRAERLAGLARPGTEAGVEWHPEDGWTLAGDWSAAAREMFTLYQPLLALQHRQRFVIGHLGQSIDGRIATRSGDSCYINGQQNLVHMHRLRALCDAVIVGATTVLSDDPQLTTRLVPGPHATRVVIDPSQRLTPQFRVCSDGRCPTLVARLPPAAVIGTGEPGVEPAAGRCGRAEIVAASSSGSGVDLPALLETLADRGLHAILVEGGGITVSRFLEQGLLDRLQIAIAPVIIGSGRQGLQLPEVLALGDCLRPSCRLQQMGADVLWDLDLRS
jgi:diaminohydroxyphosphoribosylaminopyrimidine deaminase / 5-amino-6-(5-phosphoribosylamino)uracil reductase